MTKLLVATHNAGKVRAFANLLADLEIDWLGLADVGVTEDVEETAVTFRGNALLKAQAYAKQTGLLTLADDSGLEVDALNGRPGVFTARYGGPGLTSEQRYLRLLDELQGVPAEQRAARFRCVIMLASPTGAVLAESEGVCEGQISFEPAGNNGFGYDPVFLLPDYGQTFAEFSAEEKNPLSHRGRALAEIVPLLRELLARNL